MTSGPRAVPFLAFVDDEIEEHNASELRRVAERLAGRGGGWVLGPPEFVDETDAAGVRTVGVLHRLNAAFDESGEPLDSAIDRMQLAEVETLVGALVPFSAASGVSIGFELDGGSVGWIESGTPTESLRLGLLESWTERLGGTSRDLYGESRQLARALAAAGDQESAERIEHAIAGGTTSTEILMALRYELDRLLGRRGGEEKLRSWAAELRGAIDRLLR
jgi:hypothetical protein